MLGRWQLERADQRREVASTLEAGRRAPPLQLGANIDAKELQAWRPASAQGIWVSKWSVLLDNRNLDGRPGLWLATPLMLDDRTALLVLRGWLERPIGNYTSTLISTPDGQQKITGELALRVPRLFELWSSQPNAGAALPEGWQGVSPKDPDQIDPAKLPRLQNLDLDMFAKHTGLSFLPVVLMQTSGGSDDGLKKIWPEPSVDADKNIGYAMQWFGFAAIVTIAFVVVAWRRLRPRKRQNQ
jgi:surfeit locus 1 family protein